MTDIINIFEEIKMIRINIQNDPDGWEKAQEIQPELVITDLIIPEISGKELCY